MMARFPYAHWVPATSAAVPFTGGPWKVVHHKTVTNSANAQALYGKTGSFPHFTISDGDCQQHFDTNVGSRALKNAKGGVETNGDKVIQIEVVGMPGVTMSARTMDRLVATLKWIEKTHGVPWVWPEGRPPVDSAKGYGVANGERHARVWDLQGGHYGHSQVPENEHWDPAYTDLEWYCLHLGMNKK